MSDHAFEFLQSWIVDNVNATINEVGNIVEHLADHCVWEARTRGITKADLIEAGGGDLSACMLAELNVQFSARARARARSSARPLSLRQTIMRPRKPVTRGRSCSWSTTLVLSVKKKE